MINNPLLNALSARQEGSESQIVELLGGLDIGVWFCDLPFSNLHWDATVKRHFGLPPEAPVTIEAFFDRVHPDDRELTGQNILRAIDEHTRFDMEYRTVSPSGELRWVRAIGTTTYDAAGVPKRFNGLTLDVTPAKRAASEAERSRRDLQEVFERITDGFVVFDRDLHYQFVNATGAELIGRSPQELIGKKPTDVFPEIESSPIWALLQTAITTREVGELEAFFAPLNKWFNVRVFPNEEGPSVYFRDISAAKLAEATIRDNEVRFQTLANTIPQLAWMADATGHIFWYNQRWYEYTGTTPQEMEGWGWMSVHHPDVLEAVLNQWKGSLAAGTPFDMTFPLRGADGLFRPFLTRVEPIRDAQGNVLRWFGTNTDITAQREVEEALRSNQERLRAALSAAATGTFRWDIHTDQLNWDEALAGLFGLKSQDAVKTLPGFLDHVHSDDRAAVAARFHECVVTGSDFDMEFRVVWPDGQLRWLYDRAKAFLDQSGKAAYITGACVDVTERKRFEQSLEERARIAALAADIGIAVTASNSLNEMLRMCTDALRTHTAASGAGLWVLNPSVKDLKQYASSGACHARGQVHVAEILESRRPLLANEEGGGDCSAFAGYPLLVDGALIGVVGLFGVQPFLTDTLASLESIASSLAIGIERKRNEAALRESEARKTAVLNTALDGVITIDQNSRILEFNPAAERAFGYTREQAIGAEMPELIMPASYRDLHRRGVARYTETGAGPILGKRLELEGLRADGTVFPIELAVNRIPSEGPVLFTATIRDITERKSAEEEIRRARDAAEAGNRAKSDFLASMSHELRTPLNAIIGYSEMLQEEAEDLNAGALVDDLGKIHSAGRHLLSLISDVLDLSKIEAGRMELFPETFDLYETCREVTNTIEPLIRKNDNRLVVEVPGDIGKMHADLTKVRQSLFNLLSNAAKFTHNGTITLRIEADPASPEMLRMTVADTGVGIPPERVNQLFLPFVQLGESFNQKSGGTGLGLALTKRFCELMGGTIQVQSSPGIGSEFTIILPRNVRDPEPAETISETEPAEGIAMASRPTVLVIDDDPAARDLMQRYLSREHVNAITASSGEEGLRMARERHCDLIALDVLMPGMDGWAVLQALKSDPATCDIPVVVISIVEDRNLGYSLGAAEFLTKPIDRDRLLRVLGRFQCDNPPCPVLLVEDDDATRQLLATLLHRDGWRVLEARNGVEALRVLESEHPELIILDLMMPEMNGFEFAAALKDNASWRSIPIMVITAKDVTESDRRRLNGQVKQILAKSAAGHEVLFEQIRQMVKKIAGEQRGGSHR